MSLECEIPFETSEGNKYVLSFSIFNQNNVPISTQIIDITLVAVSQLGIINSVKTFSYVINVIAEYLIDKDVILYYYCDTSEIYVRNSRNPVSFQEFRFNLFNALFSKANHPDLFIKNVIIDDENNGNHYISLIYRQNSEDEIEILSSELSKFQK
ncbi:hypothetical protein [Empedobacter stercoris]|uniref:hypothetical protein n=1 Tax=Empedobacter stercoris TaxID=1628248 RepID=UPI0039E8B226